MKRRSYPIPAMRKRKMKKLFIGAGEWSKQKDITLQKGKK
jgi:hypothetical protein